MPRKYGSPAKEIGIAYLHGRIEHEIELYASQVLNCSAEELASKIGSLLIGSVSKPVEKTPKVQREAPSFHQQIQEMATHEAPKPKSTPQGSYWAKMTPQQRKNEIKRRRAKWSQDAVDRWNKKGKPLPSSRLESATGIIGNKQSA